MLTLERQAVGSPLAARAAEAAQQARRTGRPVLISVAEPLAAGDPLVLFARGSRLAETRLYWQAPGGESALVGTGAAWEITAAGAHRFAGARAAWADLLAGALIDAPSGAGPRLLGGFAFDPDGPRTAAWTGFPAGLLVLPRFLVQAGAGAATLTTSLVLEPDTDPDAAVDRLARERDLLLGQRPGTSWTYESGPGQATGAINRASTPNGPLEAAPGRPWPGESDTWGPAESPPALHMADVQTAVSWKAAVAAVTADIRAGRLEKAVLAREVRVAADRPLDPAATLRRLRAGYPDCFVFAVARGPRCFLGATPERLVRLAGGAVQATCLAGSTRRSTDPGEDARLGAALLASPKEREEHAVVVRMLAGALADVCAPLAVPPTPALLRLRNVQHLYTPLRGQLRNGTTLLELVARLHPTPAVGGFPRAAALAAIRAAEELDRGWYAGPVGWLDAAGEGEFAVAIRSALLEGAQAHAYAGCGIVAGSDPEAEYAETQVKLRAVLAALGEPA